MPDLLNVSVANGKYTVIMDSGAHLKALRNGEPWRDIVGDKLVLALAQEIQELRDRICPVCDNMIKDPAAKACLACLPQMK